MPNTEIPHEDVIQWIQQSVQNEDIKDFTITFTGSSEKGEGFSGDVLFAKLAGFTKSTNNPKELNLVMKIGRKNALMREAMRVREIYEREIFAYSKIFPEFQKFQTENKIKNVFNSVAKCYNTIFTEGVEVLVVEDFKAKGFELHDKQILFNDAHIELILYAYAKFHAISFAMREQNKKRFEELTASYDRIPKLVMIEGNMRNYNDIGFKKTKELIETYDADLAQLYTKVFQRNITDIAADILNADVEETVVTHGDNWNNNFMFKYENEDKKTPTDVAILDFQISCLHSPVLDLSYFLYIISGEEQVSKFDIYLQYYHARLSECLKQYNCDPEKQFPFTTLMDHWEKYSAYGIIFLITTMDVLLSDQDTALSFEDIEDLTTADEWVSKITPGDPEAFKDRVLATVRYYCTNTIK